MGLQSHMQLGKSSMLVISSRVVSPDNVSPASRCWQLAGALAKTQEVILAVPEVTGLSHHGFAVVYYNHRNIGMISRDSDAVVCDAAVLREHPSLINAGAPVAVGLAGMTGWSRPGTLPGAGMESVIAVADFFFCPDQESRGTDKTPGKIRLVTALCPRSRHRLQPGESSRQRRASRGPEPLSGKASLSSENQRYPENRGPRRRAN